MIRRSRISRALALSAFLLFSASARAEIVSGGGREMFDVRFLTESESSPLYSSTDNARYTFSPALKKAVLSGYQYWADILGPGAKNTAPVPVYVRGHRRRTAGGCAAPGHGVRAGGAAVGACAAAVLVYWLSARCQGRTRRGPGKAESPSVYDGLLSVAAPGPKQKEDLLSVLGDRPCALVREISKVYQEARRGTLSSVLAGLEDGIKGELALVVAPAPADEKAGDDTWQAEALQLREAGEPIKKIAEELATEYAVPKNRIKAWLLEQK